MPIDAPHYPDETELLRLQVAACAWDMDELTRENGKLTDLLTYHREREHDLREQLRQAEEALAEQAAPMPITVGPGQVAA